jgi:hypothetical protein
VKSKTVGLLSIGTILVVAALNVAFFCAIGWVAWHFITKFW